MQARKRFKMEYKNVDTTPSDEESTDVESNYPDMDEDTVADDNDNEKSKKPSTIFAKMRPTRGVSMPVNYDLFTYKPNKEVMAALMLIALKRGKRKDHWEKTAQGYTRRLSRSYFSRVRYSAAAGRASTVRTGVVRAAAMNNYTALSGYLNAGVYLSLVDEQGDTVLHNLVSATGERGQRSLAILLQYGADVLRENYQGYTPLATAAMGGKWKYCKMMVAAYWSPIDRVLLDAGLPSVMSSMICSYSLC